MNAALWIFLILAQANLSLSPSDWETVGPEQLKRELGRAGIAIIQTIDVRASMLRPLPRLRETIHLPFPVDTRVFVVDGANKAFDSMFAVRLQPGGATQEISGFTQGRMVVIGVLRALKKRYADVLRHELVHAYLNVVAPGRDLPKWLEEGLACYFSGSPSHLNHETYRRYERDMRYLFATHPDEMPDFLTDAIRSSDPKRALFLHFRIPDSIHLHLMRLSWENALWIALILVPVLSVLFGKFLSDLLYPWYVGWRRGYLSWRYGEALARLERDAQPHIQPPSDLFLAEARKAAFLAQVVHRSVRHTQMWLEELREKLETPMIRLIQQTTRPASEQEDVCADSLKNLRSLFVSADELLTANQWDREQIGWIREFLNAVSESFQVPWGQFPFILDGPWTEIAQEYLEAAKAWNRDREGLGNALLESFHGARDLCCQIDHLAQYPAEEAARLHPFGNYATTVRRNLLAWKQGKATLEKATNSLQEAEDNLLNGLLKRSENPWLMRILTDRLRLDDLISAITTREQDRPDPLRCLARSWGKQDFLPRTQRDGFGRWLRPPDVLETICFSLFFLVFLGVWTPLRRFCAFFLLGLDRLLGG